MLTADLEIEGTEIAEIAVGESRAIARENFQWACRSRELTAEQRAEFLKFVNAEIARLVDAGL